jgi:serine/threonine protein kinase
VFSFFSSLSARANFANLSQLGPLFDRVACQRLSVRPSFLSICIELILSHSDKRHAALKIVKSAGRYSETARDEIKLLRQITNASPSHSGRAHIVSFLDSFTHTIPSAAHICISFEPLGANILSLIEKNRRKGVPPCVVKSITRQVLLGLQYLHEECDLVHTDIKPENISQFHLITLQSHELNPFMISSDVHSGRRVSHRRTAFGVPSAPDT